MDRDPGPAQRPADPMAAIPGSGTEIIGAGTDLRQIYGLPVLAELPEVPPRSEVPEPKPPRIFLPVCLFIATCMSTLLVGCLMFTFTDDAVANDALLRNPIWRGPAYMAAIMSFLFAHEMGHFLQSLRYGVRASLPYFIPIPAPPIGTMGAVIVMRSRNRHRKELFDVGLSGPWAGLLVALPMLYYGIVSAAPTPVMNAAAREASGYFPDCLLVQWMIDWLKPELLPGQELFLSPWLLAGWAATLLTGVNMLPVGQLDGGHTAYALFGRKAHWLARIALLVCGAYIIFSGDYGWSLMFILALVMRPDHPPTLDDAAPLGWPRWIIGFVSLFIPVVCLAPMPNF